MKLPIVKVLWYAKMGLKSNSDALKLILNFFKETYYRLKIKIISDNLVYDFSKTTKCLYFHLSFQPQSIHCSNTKETALFNSKQFSHAKIQLSCICLKNFRTLWSKAFSWELFLEKQNLKKKRLILDTRKLSLFDIWGIPSWFINIFFWNGS